VRTPLVSRLIALNNRNLRRVDPSAPNPWPVDGRRWVADLRAAHPAIRAEWEAFDSSGGRLPLIEDVLGGWQGNTGSWWRHGTLISRRRAMPPLAAVFPQTVAAFLAVPDLISATWSVLGPGTDLPPHVGDNAGALNFLYGVDCPSDSGHEIEGDRFRLDPGELVVFDDTRPHAAWNHADRPRVLVIGDLLRPVPGLSGRANAGVQFARHHLSPAYQRAARRNAELHRALNG
jgi:hypothetical protein